MKLNAARLALFAATAALVVGGAALAFAITANSEALAESVTLTTTETVTETDTLTVTEAARTDSPPVGLSDAGRLQWELEALLRDTFGSDPFYLHYESDVAWFDKEFTGNCCSEVWDFLFPAASGSDLVITDADHQLRAAQGASTGVVPLLIYDREIACPDGRWLYTVTGNGSGTSHFNVLCQYEHDP